MATTVVPNSRPGLRRWTSTGEENIILISHEDWEFAEAFADGLPVQVYGYRQGTIDADDLQRLAGLAPGWTVDGDEGDGWVWLRPPGDSS